MDQRIFSNASQELRSLEARIKDLSVSIADLKACGGYPWVIAHYEQTLREAETLRDELKREIAG